MTLRHVLELDGRRLTFSSGSSTLDGLLEGGFRTGELVEVFGASNTGKTQLAMQTAISAVSRGFPCAFIDTEGQFRPERLSTLCVARGVDPATILPSVFSIRAETIRRQVGAIAGLRDEKALANCKLVAVDTLTKNFTLEFGGPRMAGRRQMALGAYLSRLSTDAYLNDRAVILLNRVASVGVGGEEREVDIGGETVRHLAQKVLYLRRSGGFVMASRPDLTKVEARTKITDGGLE